MFFTIVGIGFCTYVVAYTLLTLFSDCDLELLFYKKFGKSPSEYLNLTPVDLYILEMILRTVEREGCLHNRSFQWYRRIYGLYFS